jgi:hypothetical protein
MYWVTHSQGHSQLCRILFQALDDKDRKSTIGVGTGIAREDGERFRGAPKQNPAFGEVISWGAIPAALRHSH